MKKIILIISTFLLYLDTTNAQLGINNENPNALLDIKSMDENTPTKIDGIIIPKTNTLPPNGTTKGQLLFLENNSNLANDFYYWDGSNWNTFSKGLDRSIDEALYIAYGSGYTNNNQTVKTLNFTQVQGAILDGFNINNNRLTIGKKGTYLIDISSSLKKTGTPSNRATYNYKIYKNNVLIHQAETSIPNEETTSTSIHSSFLHDLKLNDTLYVTVEKLEEIGSTIYTSYGNHSLILNFLHD